MKQITAKQREQIKGAMGGWVCRNEHTVVDVGPMDENGCYEATVSFIVDPRDDAERNTLEEMAKRRAKAARG